MVSVARIPLCSLGPSDGVEAADGGVQSPTVQTAHLRVARGAGANPESALRDIGKSAWAKSAINWHSRKALAAPTMANAL